MTKYCNNGCCESEATSAYKSVGGIWFFLCDPCTGAFELGQVNPEATIVGVERALSESRVEYEFRVLNLSNSPEVHENLLAILGGVAQYLGCEQFGGQADDFIVNCTPHEALLVSETIIGFNPELVVQYNEVEYVPEEPPTV